MLLPLPAAARAHDEIADDLIHADLPLYTRLEGQVWPQHFSDDEGNFGCTSRIEFGDWRMEAATGDDIDNEWYRVRNYGVFHCNALVQHASDRAGLSDSEYRHSFFVRLGEGWRRGRKVELWAIQIGARPGSDYLLLSREPGEGLIDRFEVLQRDCPRRNLRDAGGIDTLLTRYCAVNSRAALLALARRMLARPVLGRLHRFADAPDADDGSGD